MEDEYYFEDCYFYLRSDTRRIRCKTIETALETCSHDKMISMLIFKGHDNLKYYLYNSFLDKDIWYQIPIYISIYMKDPTYAKAYKWSTKELLDYFHDNQKKYIENHYSLYIRNFLL